MQESDPRALGISRAEPGDAADLTQIALAAKRHWGYPEAWIELWRPALTLEPSFIAENETYCAFLDDVRVGFYALTIRSDLMILEHLWVLPQAMGRGVGRALFSHAVNRAKALGIWKLEMESDPNATGFYERMGAHILRVTITELDGKPRQVPIFGFELPSPP